MQRTLPITYQKPDDQLLLWAWLQCGTLIHRLVSPFVRAMLRLAPHPGLIWLCRPNQGQTAPTAKLLGRLRHKHLEQVDGRRTSGQICWEKVRLINYSNLLKDHKQEKPYCPSPPFTQMKHVLTALAFQLDSTVIDALF